MKTRLGVFLLFSFVSLFLVIVCFPNVEASSITWTRTYNAINADAFADFVIQTNDGGYAFSILRRDDNTTFGELTPWLLKIDAEGKTVWDKDLGKYLDGAVQIAQTNDGEYLILCGQSFVKVDAGGSFLWNQSYGKGSRLSLYSLSPTNDGGFMLGGTFDGWTGRWEQNGDTIVSYENPNAICLVKVDSSGNMEWNQTYQATFQYSTSLTSVIQTSDGGYAIAGKCGGQYSNSYSDIWLAKTDASGNIVWKNQYGDPDFSEDSSSLIQTNDGGYLITGSLNNNHSWATPGLLKIDSSGSIQWRHIYSDIQGSEISSVIQTKSNEYVFAGSILIDTGRTWVDTYCYWLVGIEASGNVQWEHAYSFLDSNQAEQVVQTIDGGYIVAGEICSYSDDNMIVCLIKTDENGVGSALSETTPHPSGSPDSNQNGIVGASPELTTPASVETTPAESSSLATSLDNNLEPIAMIVAAFAAIAIIGIFVLFKLRHKM